MNKTKDATSHYYRYLVDENKGTYKLLESFEVPYSDFVSATQHVGNNKEANSGQAKKLFGVRQRQQTDEVLLHGGGGLNLQGVQV